MSWCSNELLKEDLHSNVTQLVADNDFGIDEGNRIMPFNVGPWQLLIILAIALLVFGGRGRIPAMMGDVAKGINAFRRGLKDGDEEKKEEVEGQKSDQTAADSEKKAEDK